MKFDKHQFLTVLFPLPTGERVRVRGDLQHMPRSCFQRASTRNPSSRPSPQRGEGARAQSLESSRTVSHCRGFTLLEVLVALAVLGISFIAVMGTAGQALSNAAHLRDKTIAHWVGMNVMAEQRISGVWPDTGTSDGDVQMANQEWTWEMEVSETAAEHLRRVEVRVFLEDEPESSLALVTGFIGEPQVALPQKH